MFSFFQVVDILNEEAPETFWIQWILIATHNGKKGEEAQKESAGNRLWMPNVSIQHYRKLYPFLLEEIMSSGAICD